MAMTLLDSVAIDHPGAIARNFNLYVGDVADMAGHNVDVLAVSCLPGDYTPSPNSVLGALAARGVSVQAMSGNKAANYEPDLPCWISNPVSNPQPGIAFSRVLVYEPASPATNSVNLVAAIFTALSAFRGSAQTSVAMPLVSAGSAGADPSLIMRALFFAAVSWGSRAAFPLSTINLVLYQGNPQLNAQLQTLFADLKNRYQHVDTIPPATFVNQANSVANRVQLPPYLTRRQVWGIALYTTNCYQSINSVLRASNITQPDYQASMPLFECIDSGLANLPNWIGQANRGQNDYATAYQEYQVGNILLHLAYMSYSSGSGFPAPMRIHTASGTAKQISTYSLYPGEQEVLFGRSMRDLVTQANWNSSRNGGEFYTQQQVPRWGALFGEQQPALIASEA
ncbi:ADP-ribosyltransferase [Ralstonia pseudosolanacearum]|uniref:ADP-ribosyltransferase n=1 Tax=Ralstonia pseudosolanacearum TaxID=1310165 RepID=UPI001FF94A73|nr:ADP-ribosyltransferase [Ralstonia pseudosolanacearum]